MEINEFIEYLKTEKKMSANTLAAYSNDLLGFFDFITSKGLSSLAEAGNTEVISYVLQLKKEGKTPATQNRKVASLRKYYALLIKKGVIKNNPTEKIKTPKIPRKEVDFLSVAEIEELLSAPDDSPKGKRDKALLELMYATGLRVNEIISAKLDDVNFRIGFFTCTGEVGKARIIPLGRPAKMALEEYVYNVREVMLKDNREEEMLFVNYCGRPFTRQGIWVLLRNYGKKANIQKQITPNTIRTSFAVHMIQNGADLKSLQELLGHEDINATQVYLTLTKNRIKDVYDKTHPRA